MPLFLERIISSWSTTAFRRLIFGVLISELSSEGSKLILSDPEQIYIILHLLSKVKEK